MPPRPSTHCTCGGTAVHHRGDVTCWCPRCLTKATSERCTSYAPHVPITLPAPQAPTVAAPTPSAPEPDLADRSQRIAFATIKAAGTHGATASEIVALGGTRPEPTRAALRALKRAGLIQEAPTPREVATGLSEPVWQVPGAAGDPEGVNGQAHLWG